MRRSTLDRGLALVSALVLMSTPVLAEVTNGDTYVDSNGNIVQVIGKADENNNESESTESETSENNEVEVSESETTETGEAGEMHTLDAVNAYTSKMNETQKEAINELIKKKIEEAGNEKLVQTKNDYKPSLVLGADLSDAERAKVIEILGLSSLDDIDVSELYHQEEVDALSSILPAEQIGNKAVSSVLINPLTPGSGISIGMVNIEFITNEMLYNILATAGAKDIEVKIVAPYKVSGTAALLGIIKSYSKMTGIELESDIIDLTLLETSLLARLSAKYGEEAVSKLFSKARLKVLESDVADNTRFISEIVKTMAEICKVPLEEIEVDELTNVLSSIAKLAKKSNRSEPKYIEAKDFKSELDYEVGVLGVKAVNWLFGDDLANPEKVSHEKIEVNAFEGVETNTSNVPKEAPVIETLEAVENTEETYESVEETSESAEETVSETSENVEETVSESVDNAN